MAVSSVIALPPIAFIQKFFLQPSALQFGVGVSGGCEIMVAAISAHLERFPLHIDVAADAKNAFNTWCRSQMWATLHRNFPSLYAFVKLVYGDSSDIIFFESLKSVACGNWLHAK